MSIENYFNDDVIVLASGRSWGFIDGYWGDAMWGIYLNGVVPKYYDENGFPQYKTSWSTQDITTEAEHHAPMYCHAYFDNISPEKKYTISLNATEFPWFTGGFEDPVIYKVGSTTNLIALSGGMRIKGKANLEAPFNNVCIGTSIGHPGCVECGDEKVVAESTIQIPTDHNGVVMFIAKSRYGGDPEDIGGSILLKINIDGQDVATGVQVVKTPNSVSGRTISTSYLSANSPLSQGSHTIKVIGVAIGSFKHAIFAGPDPTLIWFD